MDSGSLNYRRFREHGDEDGLAEIIKDYKDGLMLYLNSIVGSTRIAEELAEDTFVLLGTKKPRDKGKGSFKTWLYTIGRNIAIDYLRRNSKRAEVSGEETAELSDDREGLELSYIKKERKITVHRALGRLKPEYRQALWLVYFEELSEKETAAVMKKSVHGTETLIYRAKRALKSVLETEGFTYEDL